MENSNKSKSLKQTIGAAVLLSGILSFFLCFYADRVRVSEEGSGLLEGFSPADVFLNRTCLLLFLALTLLLILAQQFGSQLGAFLYRYRFFLCLAVFAVCVLFEVNGSSIGIWNRAGFLGGEDTGLLLGASRTARSDEWFVSTPMALSQYHDPEGAFPYFSSIVRGTATDVFLEYGQPVRDIAVLFRPFHWGYLLLSPGKGLAFFWCGRMIALFLVSFEMGMLITEKRRSLSLGYALLMVLSPTVQWWFAVNGLVEMLVYSQLSILMLRSYLTSEKTAARAGYAAVILLCAGGFILTLYPAWMMPVAWVLLGLIIWQFLENLRYCRLHKRDVLILLLEAAVFMGILAHVFLNSRGTIEALLNTVYPGSRFETGGGEGKNLFNYLSEIWYPMLGEGTMVNSSESSQFIDFFPLCYIIPAVVLIRDRSRDKLLIILLAVSLFFEGYMILGVPKLLAGLTLMSFSTAHRTLQTAGFCHLILLFRSTALLKKRIHPAAAGCTALAAAAAGTIQNVRTYGQFYQGRTAAAAVSCAVFFLCFWLLMSGTGKTGRKLLVCLIAGIAFSAGALANPVRLGVKNITENENIREIEAVVQSDPTGVWVIEGLGVPMNNAGILAGAPTLNATNIYPDLERWRKIDQGEHEDVYNRYAHILVNLQPEGEASFELYGEDYFRIDCTLEDLRTMGVTYILTGRDLDAYGTEEQPLTLVRSWDPFRVYKIG